MTKDELRSALIERGKEAFGGGDSALFSSATQVFWLSAVERFQADIVGLEAYKEATMWFVEGWMHEHMSRWPFPLGVTYTSSDESDTAPHEWQGFLF